MGRNLREFMSSVRDTSTPIIGINTVDQIATVRQVDEIVSKGSFPVPLLQWDIIRGMIGLNSLGGEVVRAVCGSDDPLMKTGNLAECLSLAVKLPGETTEKKKGKEIGGTVLFVLDAHNYIRNEAVSQAVGNLRDLFKQDRRTLVLLGPQIQLPIERREDVITFDEELPEDEQLGKIVDDMCVAAGELKVSKRDRFEAIRAVRGLGPFSAEQIVAMSLTDKGIDLESLWARKRAAVEQTPGLKVDRGGETLESIGGLEQIKQLGLGLREGPEPIALVVRVEEIEKGMAGARGDTSGTSQDQLGVVLNEMEDNDWTGLIAVGPGGSGKSLCAKVFGSIFRCMSISLDFGAAKGSLVGQSEQQIRAAMRVIYSIAGKRGAFFIATCNKLEVLPPELRRRFRMGIWFFDLPLEEERGKIWPICLKRYGLDLKLDRPPDDGWTGADIRNCCEIAWRRRCSLAEASQFLVPISRSDPESIDYLRNLAHNRFLSASYPGQYQLSGKVSSEMSEWLKSVKPIRKISVGEEK